MSLNELGNILYTYLYIKDNSQCLTKSWNFKILCSAKRLLVCCLLLAFEMYLTEHFCSEQILFMPGSAEFPQATIPYSIRDLNSELNGEFNPKKPGVLKDLYSPGRGASQARRIKVSNLIHILMCDT